MSAQEHSVIDARGFQQNRDYFSQLSFENIDTLSGALVLRFTDLVLAGNAGRELRFTRTYNSKGSPGVPDGREVRYQNAQLERLFSFLAARSDTVRATLALYAGSDRPDLLISHGDAGTEEGRKALGKFHLGPNDYHVDYGERVKDPATLNMTKEEVENLGSWSLRRGEVVLDRSLRLDVRDKNTVRTALHELGHADQAVRNTLQFIRDSRRVDSAGAYIPYAERPAETYATGYADKIFRRILF